MIPYIQTEAEYASNKKNIRLFFVLLAVVALVALAIFHFAIMPLDTFFLLLSRKLGV